jgi:glyceraldehyde-3-phosphate dehydrogenase/erythrose-4-phosphate dehydrogenase
MTISIGMKGFSRMGRLGLRGALDRAGGDATELALVHVNGIACDARGMASTTIATTPPSTIW